MIRWPDLGELRISVNSEVRDVCVDLRYSWLLIVQTMGPGAGENAGSTGFLPTTDPTRQVKFTSRGDSICCPYSTSVPSCGNRMPDTSQERLSDSNSVPDRAVVLVDPPAMGR
jgi:hypothetical protein